MKDIKILGTGCKKCVKLFNQAELAAKELALEYTIEKITELDKIMDYGVMMTPALVVDGEIKVVGTVPKLEDLKKLLV